MNISILLPYKEDYTKSKAGAVSIFLFGHQKISKYKKNIKIFGSTIYKDKLSKNYVEIPFKKNILQSSSKEYVKSFINIEKKYNSKLIEIHNRPEYFKFFDIDEKKKYILYFHNDPLQMKGSTSKNERLLLINKCNYIIFNSNWTKNRFITNLDKFYSNSPKLIVIEQSVSKVKINFKKKKKIIIYVGKLNSSKGYDIFGNAIIKILNKYPTWKAIVIGDEPREKIEFNHKNLFLLGHRNHQFVLNYLKKSSISVTPSKWEEPFGRSSLEASSRGCAVIISNKGGLNETVTDGIILKELTSKSLQNTIEYLITKPKILYNYQFKSYKNFYLTDKYITSKIDNYRKFLINKKKNYKFTNNRILHVTNFNERHNGRLFYNTGRRLNNGFVRLKNSVLTLSDRDTISSQRSIIDVYGSKSLNNKLLEVVGNFKPNIIVFGHADLVSRESIMNIKKIYPNIKMSQWFLDKMDNKKWKLNKIRFEKIKDLMNCSFCTTYPDKYNNEDTFFIPNPVDSTFENLKIFNKKNYKFDVFFALSHGVHRGVLKYGKFDEREIFLKKLINKLPNIKFDIYGLNNSQPIWAEKYKENLSQSPMAINLSQGLSQKYYSSDRIAQLIGNGLLTFVDKRTKLNDFFNNNEVIFYNSVNDLAKKIVKYKNNTNLRNKISKNGYKKYHTYMSSDIVAEYMIKRTLGLKNYKKFIFC